METFSVLRVICAGISPVTGEFSAQRPVTRSFGVFFNLRLNKRLSKQSWGWWFEMPSRPLLYSTCHSSRPTRAHYRRRTSREQSSWGQHGAHLGPVGPRWAPCWPHEPCYQGCFDDPERRGDKNVKWILSTCLSKWMDVNFPVPVLMFQA